MYSNKLTTLPPEIGQLTSLTKFELNNNHLTSLPPEIGQLTNLGLLYLIGNELTTLPPEIRRLVSLEKLALRSNKLTAVPPEIGQLIKLKNLDLSDNKLDSLPEIWQQLAQLEILYLHGNPALDISQEVLQTRNPSLILKAYFGERHPLHEAKMLLVGQGGVGKTALARRLLHNLSPDENLGKTPGVDIHKWQVTPANTDTPITLNLWDFGGQGVYQATHQFFFTSRSLYLVVINARTGEQESRLRHWLKLVASLSDSAPVIAVVNKQDEHALQLDERALKHKYPNLLAVTPTSCTTGQGIAELRKAIAAALSQLPHIYDRFPTDWLTLKAQLEKMDSNYITYEQYAEYCREVGIHDRADQRSWVKVLHQLGVVLNYQDENYRQLEGTHVLKPEWVTDGVYRILSDPDQRIAHNAGILTAPMLDYILDPDVYPHHQQTFIVGMMQKFELCFRLPNGQNQYLIPDLLPKEQPEEAESFQNAHLLQFEIHYTDFLPDSILSRFMVGMMAVLDRHASWRNGAVLQFGGNHALVRADLETRQLFITVAGAETTRRSLLNSIRMQLHVIHSTFPNLPLTEQVPIPDHPGKTIDYEELLWYESEGMLNPPYAPIRGKIDVKALLDGIETPALRRERRIQEQLMQAYNLDELAQLCFDLAVDFEDLPGTTPSTKTRELVQYMGRNNRLDELESALRR
ncbi:MAG: leucine-rich repeat domain-containing protein [Ardenticatenaceae bacterium]|nr:leucine-rich repeat domain-containing protein [Ardenticatenaceae bacterium]